ncbi:hypothetical protein PGIGA_G00260520 [Pangasianodon gigas]|uniref:Uncharacterized protein n=1 Tax=Pangasianodon gigas TaxID=30993 RepID=A0ACC5WV47_PANGG|nr:hypothetical protein [Pangasianodon gigas]
MLILQWNARSLLANGQEFKGFIKKLKGKPDIICIQETWLKPNLDFVIHGYSSIRKDRDSGNGGGCAVFIKEGINHSRVQTTQDLELIVVEIWTKEGNVKIINFYNPCKKLEKEKLERILEHWRGKIIWCGDFNAHSTVWGDQEDANGEVIEELMDEKELVCLNDGSGTRVNLGKGTESALDLTLVSQSLAGISTWDVSRESTLGSDHYPVFINIGIINEIEQEKRKGRWKFEKAVWNKFRILSEKKVQTIDIEQPSNVINSEISRAILEVAKESIPKQCSKSKKKIVPLWTEECTEAIQSRNKAFKL